MSEPAPDEDGVPQHWRDYADALIADPGVQAAALQYVLRGTDLERRYRTEPSDD